MKSVDKRIDFFDGLRGIAILLVVGSHIFPRSIFFIAGKHGVLIFFSLSAYLNTKSFLRSKKPFGWKNIKNFWLRRIIRIYPAFVLGVLLLSIIGKYLNDPFDTWGILTLDYKVYSFIFWTIRVELMFYLFLPLLLLGLTVLKIITNNNFVFIFIWIWIVAFYQYRYIDIANLDVKRGFIDHLPIFLLGSGLSMVNWEKYKRIWQSKYVLPIFQLLAIGFFVVTIPKINNLVFHFTLVMKNRLWQFGIIHNLIIIYGSIQDNWFKRFLENKILVSMGKMSYSWFLTHPFFGELIKLCPVFFDKTKDSILAFVFSIVAAFVFYQTIEKPTANWARRIR